MTARINVLAFPGAPNLPIFAAFEQGYFGNEGLEVGFTTTPSSVFQFEQFGAGACDVVFTAFDNIVAYGEGQGAAKIDNGADFRVVMGASQVELSVVVAPDVKSAADLKGKSLALDAVGTGFAFVLYAILEKLGLPKGDYKPIGVGATPERWQSVKDGQHAGTISIEPFTSIARAAGFGVLARSTDVFPVYQGGVVAARASWLSKHADEMSRFIRAYLRGLRWTLDPANRDAAAKLLLARMPEIKPGVVGAVLNSVLSERSGLTPDGAILRDGMKTVLDLRSRYGSGATALTDIDKYLDLSIYAQAKTTV
jgi:ABC-type nitrate/sulfonate/bicarbonate transport system substrate-binding protein